jgi:hypothetical protein
MARMIKAKPNTTMTATKPMINNRADEKIDLSSGVFTTSSC